MKWGKEKEKENVKMVWERKERGYGEIENTSYRVFVWYILIENALKQVQLACTGINFVN